MDQELERIADIVAARVREHIGSAGPVTQSCVLDCTQCGQCVLKLERDVRAIKSTGAVRVSAAAGLEGAPAPDLAGLIDHTLLKADATREEVEKLCEEARKYTFASVCVNSANVARAKAMLRGAPVMVCAVVGFPLGAMSPSAKAFEAREAVRAGAQEIDMVINIGALKDGDYALVAEDISRVVAAAAPAKVKVIIETALLDEEQKVAACTLSKLAGAHFVKTSTGFSTSGATVGDVALMRRVVGGALGVKASGGVRSAEDVKNMVAAGATRVGASASVAIVTGKQGTSKY
ncbi:MAG: deoxyribose-phosphate aldolase [Myxococcales bacterium]|nr:deoxyribose-phosphate aldolase [Myxococcales bacterium]